MSAAVIIVLVLALHALLLASVANSCDDAADKKTLTDLPEGVLFEIGRCLPLRSLIRMGAAAPRQLRWMAGGFPDHWHQALFDLRTPETLLPKLLGAWAATLTASVDHSTGLATADVSLQQAALLYDRLLDGGLPRSVQVELLDLLLTNVNTSAFFALSVSDSAYHEREGCADRLLLDWSLYLPRLRHLRPELAAAVDQLPHIVLDAVRALTEAVDRGMPSPDASSLIAQIRALFPPPFDQVFPYNHLIAQRLYDHLQRTPAGQYALRQAAVVSALVRLGLRPPDLSPFMPLDADAVHPDHLRAVFGLARPHLYLFRCLMDGVVGHRCPLLDAYSPPADGVGVHLRVVQPYLPALLQTDAFVAYLQRNPRLLVGIVSIMAARHCWAFFDVLAQLPLLALPAFGALAHDLVDFLVGDGRKQALWLPCVKEPVIGVRSESLIRLLTLPTLDLYRPLWSGSAPLRYLVRDPIRYADIVGDEGFLRRLQSESSSVCRYYETCDMDEQQWIEQLLREASVHSAAETLHP